MAFPTIGDVRARAYRIPTDAPEQDGTADWESTTLVVAEVDAGGETGLGYTYGPAALTGLIDGKLAGVLSGASASDTAAAWQAMGVAVRNAGRPGMAMMALSALDVALWDLKARLLEVSVAALVGAAHEAVPVYGSGGFTSYSPSQLARQAEGWMAAGIPRVKIKTSRRPDEDPTRLDTVRKVIGDDVELFADANGGALTRKEALYWATRLCDEWDVRWFEEPVSSEDREGLRLLRDRGPARLDIAAGEYGYLLSQFRDLLTGGCVDCLQADHVRIEQLAFDGTLVPDGGSLRPDRSRAGLGLELKAAVLERYRVT